MTPRGKTKWCKGLVGVRGEGVRGEGGEGVRG